VLFTGSSSFISESSAEVGFVRRWIAALRASPHPELREINVLVRPHPYNFHRWADDPVADLPRVTVYPRRPYNPVEQSSRDDFFDSLYHCAVVVGINTSAMVEAAIIGRPVCSMLAPEFAKTQEGTIHFHHLLPEHGGFLRIASTLEQACRSARRLPAQSGRYPRGKQSGSSPRSSGHRAATAPPRLSSRTSWSGSGAMPLQPATSPLLAPVLRLLTLVAALPAFAVDQLRPQALARLGKRINSAPRRTTKRLKKAGARLKRLIP
jgi:hypothetical protein